MREFDIIVWATGFDFGTGALNRMGIRGRDGLALTEHWADGPTTFLGLQTRGFPNFFFPGGPHAAAGNNPRYNGDLVDIVTDTILYALEHGFDVIEVSEESEERWTRMVDKGAAVTTFGTIGQYVGSNIPGKPRRYLLNTGGRMKLFEISAQVVADDYRAYEMSKAPAAGSGQTGFLQTVAIGVSGEPTMPGRRSGGAVSRKRLRPCSRSHVASSWRYHISPSGTPSLNRHSWWIGSSVRLPSTERAAAEHRLDRVVVGDQRRDPRVGDPLEQ